MQDKPSDKPTGLSAPHLSCETERWARMVLESIDVAFFALDREWRFTYINAEAERLLGRPREALLGKGAWSEIPEAVGTPFWNAAQKVMRERVPVELNAQGPKSGQWLDVRIFPTEEGIVAYCRDVTSRRDRVQRLRLLETAVAQLNDIVLITEARPIDEPGPRIVFVNAAFERMTGYTREEVMGKSPRILQGPRTSREALDRIHQALERCAPICEEIVNYTKDGREFLIEIDIVPILDDDGHCSHFVAVERDMTERRKLEEQLLHAQKMEAIGRLAGGVAHDFNNLLTAIKASADFLREEVGPRGNADILEIERACGRATELTRRLLALGRRQVLEQHVLDMNAVVGDMERMLSRVIGEGVALEVSLAPKLAACRADPAQLQQVILNLAMNARDAMPQGGRLVIRTDGAALDAQAAGVRGLSSGRYAVLSVIDNGVGMDEATRRRAFEPFYTTKEPGRGSGLGLSTVYGVVSQCGGSVEISSALGKGTTVKVYLPVVDVHPAPAEGHASRRAGS
ncbi:hybrid sensor histidine kinase/response regulator [Polyangium aurulentum]|uniref:hybrid sensor histidine kinase/response regulator n=1 Tax=Polyangium aurulentum TaxID=2567896 RepID=UPI0010ADEADA|nr:PAS domain-containing sensor histidine kinase [Polyangium aurulentum]UQA60301.1 PAS domain S-box protein [Polyangium aurulentum]